MQPYTLPDNKNSNLLLNRLTANRIAIIEARANYIDGSIYEIDMQDLDGHKFTLYRDGGYMGINGDSTDDTEKILHTKNGFFDARIMFDDDGKLLELFNAANIPTKGNHKESRKSWDEYNKENPYNSPLAATMRQLVNR